VRARKIPETQDVRSVWLLAIDGHEHNRMVLTDDKHLISNDMSMSGTDGMGLEFVLLMLNLEEQRVG
jgi:hypothetical protein